MIYLLHGESQEVKWMGAFHKLITKSISSKLYRSIGLVMIGLILSYAMVIISLIAVGMQHGSKNVVERMGADLIVVPKGYGKELEGILLTTQKSYFYMDASILDQIESIDGVDKVSPQTFLMTMEASCCDQAVQIIGIDIESDFIVTPWIERKYITSLNSGEIIVGSKVTFNNDKTFQMFGKRYQVAAVLDESGSSMDATIFVSREEMQNLMRYAQQAGQGIITEVNSKDISTVMVKVSNKENIQSVVARLSGISGIDIVTADAVSSKLSVGLTEEYIVYAIVISIIMLVSILLLYIIYYITLNERKKEIEVLRTIGVSRNKIKGILIEEVFLTSCLGAFLGTGLGFCSFRLLFQCIEIWTKIPFTIPLIKEEILILFTSFLLTTCLGPLCVAVRIRKVCPEEVLE